jgi:uroporphyrinogen decarboxylase
MTKRDRMLELAAGNATPGYVPAAFFLHFGPAWSRGQPAVDRHLEYFRATGMDFVKIQYEHPWPALPGVKKPDDWARITPPGPDHFEEPLAVIAGIVKAARKDAVVIVTLYSPFMHAGHATSGELLTDHLSKDPAAVAAGLRKIAQSVLLLVRGCVKAGVDGFYMSTQGGEAGRFASPRVFTEGIMPSDLLVMEEVQRTCAFTILHVCDYHGIYEDLAPYRDYPGHIVNTGVRLSAGPVTPKQAAEVFNRPVMGGMDRHGILVTGTKEQIRAEVSSVLRDAPPLFALGADCTVPADIPWENLRTAIDTAHAGR